MEDIDIWRTARILIEAHGEDAAMHAAMRADDAKDENRQDAASVWTRVMSAAEELLRQKTTTGDSAN